MALSEEYPYLYKYYCKKYAKRVVLDKFANKPAKFLSRANEILKWKDSFDKVEFYEIKKIDNPSYNYWNITRLARQSNAKMGSGFGYGCLCGAER